jgi:dual specificity tyrosine-phosphorylation-regulated kinase 2/3/4
VVTLPDGSTSLQGGRSRRGKPRGLPGSRDWIAALKGCDDPLFIDFLKRCLDWDPSARMTPSQALRHSWLRRRLPRAPNENPTPSRRTSATYRNNLMPKLSNGTGASTVNTTQQHNNVLHNASNTSNTVNHHSSGAKINMINGGGGGGGSGESELNKHTKLPKIGAAMNGSNNNLRSGS